MGDSHISGNEPSLHIKSDSDNAPQLGSSITILHALENLRHEDWQVRAQAGELLAQIGSDQVLDTLSAILSDTHTALRGRVAEAIGEIGGEKAYEILTQAFEHGDKQTQRAALSGLVHYPDPSVIRQLIDVLAHANKAMREEAANSLERIGEATTPCLLAVLQTDSGANDKPTRTRAILRLLGKIGGALDDPDERNRYYEVLAPYLESHQYDDTALGAIADLGAPASLDTLIQYVYSASGPPETQEEYYARIDSHGSGSRPSPITLETKTAFRGLARLGVVALPAVLHAALSVTREVVSELCVFFEALPPSAMSILVEHCLTLSKEERDRIVSMTHGMSSEAQQALVELVWNDQRCTRNAALDLLSLRDYKNVQLVADIALQHDDISTQCHAIRILGEVRKSLGYNQLAESIVDQLLSSDNSRLKRAAIRALIVPDTFSAGIVCPLVDLIEGDDRHLHHVAVRALGEVDISGFFDPLHAGPEENLIDSEHENRCIRALLKAATPSYTYVTRYYAIQVLGRKHITEAIPLLLNTLTDDSPRLRQEAATSLVEIMRSGRGRDHLSIAVLCNALEHEVEFVRYHAARALVLAWDRHGKELLVQAREEALNIPYLTQDEIEEALATIS